MSVTEILRSGVTKFRSATFKDPDTHIEVNPDDGKMYIYPGEIERQMAIELGLSKDPQPLPISKEEIIIEGLDDYEEYVPNS